MSVLPQQKISSPEITSFLRFAVVGMLGTGVDLSLFLIGQSLFHLPMLVANTISYCAGIANNYYFHRTWTFGAQAQPAVHKQFSLFVIISLAALALNNLVIALLTPILTSLLPDPGLAVLFAKACATITGLSWNFLANRHWTFRNPSA
jgi:putative flippase GtrA